MGVTPIYEMKVASENNSPSSCVSLPSTVTFRVNLGRGEY